MFRNNVNISMVWMGSSMFKGEQCEKLVDNVSLCICFFKVTYLTCSQMLLFFFFRRTVSRSDLSTRQPTPTTPQATKGEAVQEAVVRKKRHFVSVEVLSNLSRVWRRRRRRRMHVKWMKNKDVFKRREIDEMLVKKKRCVCVCALGQKDIFSQECNLQYGAAFFYYLFV